MKNMLILITIIYVAWSERLETETLQEIWKSSGCNMNGILYPTAKNLLSWNRIDISAISRISKSEHPLAKKSCKGEDQILESEPHTFHLLWECYDHSRSCLLPTINVKTLKTLLHFHPHSTVHIWSNSLTEKLVLIQVAEDIDNVSVRKYNETMFEDVPRAAHDASQQMLQFFGDNPQTHSHFSDLFRLAVLWKYGGVWADFDSLWVNSVDQLSKEKNWIPLTEKSVKWEKIDDKYFVEGGVMKFEKNHPFLFHALNNFPEYNEDIANCWACVGPKLLTETYINMYKNKSKHLPSHMNSELIFGGREYRSNLKLMHSALNVDVFSHALDEGVVAFHLFTSSGSTLIEPGSTIDALFSASGVQSRNSWFVIPLGRLSYRRGLEGSVDYHDSVNYDTTTPVVTTEVPGTTQIETSTSTTTTTTTESTEETTISPTEVESSTSTLVETSTTIPSTSTSTTTTTTTDQPTSTNAETPTPTDTVEVTTTSSTTPVTTEVQETTIPIPPSTITKSTTTTTTTTTEEPTTFYQDQVVLDGDFNSIVNMEQWISDCSSYLENENTQCISIYESSIGVNLQSKSESDLQSAVEKINNSGLYIDFMGITYDIFVSTTVAPTTASTQTTTSTTTTEEETDAPTTSTTTTEEETDAPTTSTTSTTTTEEETDAPTTSTTTTTTTTTSTTAVSLITKATYFVGNYDEIIGNTENKFLQECSAYVGSEYSLTICQDVHPGQLILVVLLGPESEVTTLAAIFDASGLDLPSYPRLVTATSAGDDFVVEEDEATDMTLYYLIAAAALLLCCTGLVLWFVCCRSGNDSELGYDNGELELVSDGTHTTGGYHYPAVPVVYDDRQKRTPSTTKNYEQNMPFVAGSSRMPHANNQYVVRGNTYYSDGPNNTGDDYYGATGGTNMEPEYETYSTSKRTPHQGYLHNDEYEYHQDYENHDNRNWNDHDNRNWNNYFSGSNNQRISYHRYQDENSTATYHAGREGTLAGAMEEDDEYAYPDYNSRIRRFSL